MVLHMGVTTWGTATPRISDFFSNLRFLSPFEAISSENFSLAPLASHCPHILPLLTSLYRYILILATSWEKFCLENFLPPPAARNDVTPPGPGPTNKIFFLIQKYAFLRL